jgi:hypothetical protein
MLSSYSTSKLTSTLNKQPDHSQLIAHYQFPRKVMLVTATYKIQQQKRYRKISPAPTSKKSGRTPAKRAKYNKVPFDYFVVTVDGDVNLKYWLEDEGSDSTFYYLTSDKKTWSHQHKHHVYIRHAHHQVTQQFVNSGS